ncbi:MAG: hypothetical protein AABN95_26970 [Acidobacteriota bacterium]
MDVSAKQQLSFDVAREPTAFACRFRATSSLAFGGLLRNDIEGFGSALFDSLSAANEKQLRAMCVARSSSYG